LNTPWEFLGGLGSGLVGGALSGLFGVGGGIVMVPLLGVLLHLKQHQAQGVTLAAMLFPIGLPAVLHYRAKGVRIRWNLVLLLLLGFLGGVWLGAVVANRIHEGPLRWGFIAFLLLLAVRAALQASRKPRDEGSTQETNTRSLILPGLVVGFAGGLGSGLLGIGGGLIIIPLLAWWLGMPQHEAQVTSLALMLPPIGLPGVLVYARSQAGLPWLVLLGVILGFLAGTALGARLATRTQGPVLRWGFIGLMVAMAGLLAARG
jgi:hypothetical protein